MNITAGVMRTSAKPQANLMMKKESETVGKKEKDNNQFRDEYEDTIDEYEDDFIEDDMPLDKRSQKNISSRAAKKQRRLEAMSYEERIAAHKRVVRRRILAAVAAVFFIAVVIVAAQILVTYSSYRVVTTEERTEGTNVSYRRYYNKILRYSKDGVVFYENQKKDIWNETYEMQNPIIDICGRYIVIADQNGTDVAVYDLDGEINSFEVTKSVKNVQISEKGTVALLLEQDGSHYIQYLDSEGSLIAEGKIEFEQTGYPLDMSLSDDGLKLAVSYLTVGSGESTTNLVFYSFSDIGSTATDNIVSQMQYEDTIIPTITYADDDTVFAFGDSGLIIFKGSQAPEVYAEITADEEIKSVFSNEKYAGMVFQTDDGYRMDIYNLRGEQILSQEFDFAYETIKIEGNQIIMFNSEEWCIYTVYGKQKLAPCELSGSVTDIVMLAKNKFILVKANKTEIVKLKIW